MKKKLVTCFALLLATAAFAGMPAAAQAVPHWYSNGVLITTTEKPTVVAFGTVSLKVVKGAPGAEVTCEIAEMGTVENPTGGGAGKDLVNEVIPAKQCESQAICPAGLETSVTPYPSALKIGRGPLGGAYFSEWPSTLEESSGVIRDNISVGRIKIDCWNASTKKTEGSEVFTGDTKPVCRHGTSALHPSFLEWTAGSGELEVEGSGGTVTAIVEGEVKFMGWFEQELIQCKNP